MSISNEDKNKQDHDSEDSCLKNEKLNTIIKDLSIFKNLDDSTITDIRKNSKLIKYKVGQPLSKLKIIPNRIQIVLEGEIRLLNTNENNYSTIQKLGKGSIIGLASLLSNNGCEEVSAATKVTVLTIPDKIILKLYEEETLFNYFCKTNVFPSEILFLSSKLLNKCAKPTHSMIEVFNKLVGNIRLINQDQLNTCDPNEIILAGSNSEDICKIGDILKSNKDIESTHPFQLRLFSLSKLLYDEIIGSQSKSFVKAEEKAIENLSKYSEQASIFPEKTSISYKRSNKKFELIRASGTVQEVIACIKMLAIELEIPFRKEFVEKIINDEYKRNKKISLRLCGNITSTMGLYSGGIKINRNLATRIPTPSLIPWKGSFAIIKDNNADGLTIFSPNSGVIKIPTEDFSKELPDELEVLVVEKSNLTPNKNFNLEWFLPSLKKYKGSLFLVLIASFVVQLFGLANPLLIQVIIDKVISQRSLDTLQILGIALVAVTILGGIMGTLRTFLFTETTNRIDTRLGAEVIDHLLRLPLNYFDRRPVGELSSRVSELEKIRNFLTGQALTTILDAAFSIIYIIVMVIYSWLLTLIALIVVPIQIGITLLGSPIIRRQIRNVAVQNASTQSHLVEVLTGVQTVKAQNVETISRWKWQDLYSQYISKTFEKTITSTALSQTSTVLQQLSQLFVLWIGASLVLKGELTLGQLIAFRIISGYVTQPLLRLSNIWQSIQELKVSFERLADIIDTTEESNESDKLNIPLPEIKGNIKFKDVSFSFKKGSPQILKKINLEITQGEFVGIAGQSGSGKSTLMKLLPRLYEIEEGKILIDDYDVSKTELYSVRRQIGIVPQEPLLFSGTVSENIALTKPDVDSEEIIRAAKIADAHDFIMSLPQGYSTNVGERGSSLSGGQKQRIAIARTIISNPKLLIMDEATSALDYQTEKKVCDNLKTSCKGVTVFFITHRLSTIKNADKIIMMNEGSIAEIGNHNDLIENKGRYYALYRQQEAN